MALTLLAWATQTLYSQWGFGQAIPLDALGDEKFIPGAESIPAGATLELRGEASVIGAEVKLRQVARWEAKDNVVFNPIADLVLCRLSEQSPFRSINSVTIKQTLADAGVNLAAIKFAGATSCMVNRSDVKFDEQKALDQWINARNPELTEAPATQPAPEQRVAASPEASAEGTGPPADAPRVSSLRDQIIDDLCARLDIERDSVQMTFSPKDEKVLNLIEPQFRFQITPEKVYGLGEVRWAVLILSGETSQQVTVKGTARQWQNQVIVNRAMSARQSIRAQDVIERRVLTDRLPGDPLLRMDQIVGQQAGRDLKSGMLLTAKLVDAAPLVRVGQLVTVSLSQGGITVRTVARAMEGGTFGQQIKVRNDATKDVYEIILTGPQEGTMGATPATEGLATGHE